MTRVTYLVRYFLVVPPMPLMMLGAFAVIVCAAVTIIAIDPSRAVGTLTPVFLLQLFACSSGFDVPARRGHYDLLLTHGQPRRRILAGHWAASALPGVAAWALVAGVHHALTPGESGVSLFSTGTISALAVVSTVPWATTVRLPRFSGAIGWLLAASTLALIVPGIFMVDIAGAAHEWRSWLHAAIAVLVYPPLLVGQELAGRDALVIAPALAFAAAALIVAFRSVNRRDIPLEAAQ